jgi:adenylate kinase family enzyme
MRYLSEARGVKTVGIIKFNYKGKELKFPRRKAVDSFRGCSVDIYNWLYENRFDFSKIKNVYNNNGLFYTESEKKEIVDSGRYQSRYFAKIDNTDKYILAVGNISQFKETIENMLSIFGCDSLVFEGFDSSDKIKKFKEVEYKLEDDSVEKMINTDDLKFTNDKIDDDFSDMEETRPFIKFPQPFDIEDELTKAQSQSEEDVLSFNKFRATEPDERPDELMIFNSYIKNPFSQAICVLGESGAGKSTTLDNILKNSGHIYQYIIPSASTTGLLSQFSPSAGAAGGYIPSRLGQMIEKAYNNKDVNYTAVFDECHKTSIIEMINDELLQSISKNRNKGVRFISLDDDTRRLYPSAREDNRGNVLIPDNFGFIFISSNARVISGNPDFFNRVDIIELTEDDRKLQSIEELNQKRVTSTSDKKELVNKIVSTSNNIS